MSSKKKGKSKGGYKKDPKRPETPSPVIIRPNVYEIVQRRLQRERAARTAAWLLYPDAPAYVKDLELDDPVDKKKKGARVPMVTPPPVTTGVSTLVLPGGLNPTLEATMVGMAGMTEAEAAKAKTALIFSFNMKEFEVSFCD